MTRRLQVLIETDRWHHLERLARQQDRTVAALVRDALDRSYPLDLPPADVAAARFLEREPLELGSWEDAKELIESALDRGLPT